jgi:uncharacterized protein YidB (DUF937 family)
MGLLDNLESQAVTKMLGSSANPLAASLLQMIQDQPGGLQGLLQSFHEKGFGAMAASWASTGQNLPISADQIQHVLGSDQVKDLAAKAGISSDIAGPAIAQLLPTLVDNLTPNGQVGDHSSVMDIASGLLKSFQAAKAS